MTRSQLSSKLQYVKCLLELWPFLTHKIVKDIAVSKAVASTSTVFMKQVAASSIIKKAYGMDWQNASILEEKKKVMVENCDSSYEQCWKQCAKTSDEDAIAQHSL